MNEFYSQFGRTNQQAFYINCIRLYNLEGLNHYLIFQMKPTQIIHIAKQIGTQASHSHWQRTGRVLQTLFKNSKHDNK